MTDPADLPDKADHAIRHPPRNEQEKWLSRKDADPEYEDKANTPTGTSGRRGRGRYDA